MSAGAPRVQQALIEAEWQRMQELLPADLPPELQVVCSVMYHAGVVAACDTLDAGVDPALLSASRALTGVALKHALTALAPVVCAAPDPGTPTPTNTHTNTAVLREARTGQAQGTVRATLAEHELQVLVSDDGAAVWLMLGQPTQAVWLELDAARQLAVTLQQALGWLEHRRGEAGGDGDEPMAEHQHEHGHGGGGLH